MKNREKGHQTQFTFRFILKFFSTPALITPFFSWILAFGSPNVSAFAQSKPSITLLNEVSIGTQGLEWAKWSPRLRTSFQSPLGSFDFKVQFSLAGHYTFLEQSELQALNGNSVRERFSLKEIAIQRSWSRVDLKAGLLNMQWGVSSDGPISQFFGRADLSDFSITEQEDLPLGQYALQSRIFLGVHRLELVLSPLPNPAPLPDRNSRWDFISEVDEVSLEWTPKRPRWTLEEAQLAIRFVHGSQSRWTLEWVAGRWTGSFPTFGFEGNPNLLPLLIQTQGLNVSEVDTPLPPSPGFTLKEDYKPKWISGISMEYEFKSPWILKSDHLIRFNQKHIELPFASSRALDALQDPLLAAELFPLLIGEPDFHLSTGVMSQHHVSAERVWGDWTLMGSFSYTYYYGLNENSLRNQSRSTLFFSTRNLTFRDRLLLQIGSQWNLDPFDFQVHPSTTWQARDEWALTAGIQLFGGNSPDPLFTDISFYTFRNSGFGYIRFTIYAF